MAGAPKLLVFSAATNHFPPMLDLRTYYNSNDSKPGDGGDPMIYNTGNQADPIAGSQSDDILVGLASW